MPSKKTLIVVGAGASKEGELPTGSELKHTIARLLDIRFKDGFEQSSGDQTAYFAIQDVVRRRDGNLDDVGPHVRAAWKIRDAMPLAMSIDTFIDAHQGNHRIELCGKLAIVQSILQAERSSLLYFDRTDENCNLNFESLKDTWFNAFVQLLTEDCRADQLEERLSTVRLVVFNYDRCVEHFLFHAFQIYYDIAAKEAAELVRGIEIYHPYGTVGALPWYGGLHAVEFGAEVDWRKLVDLAGEIKTFTEGTDPESSDVLAIRRATAEADTVLFLGFAYHGLNLELIGPPDDGHANPEVVRYFGTAKEISDSDCQAISVELIKLAGAIHERITLRNDLTCNGLFREYRRTLILPPVMC